MPSKTTVRKVKFTSGEMAFEPLLDYSHLDFKRRKPANLVKLDPDLASFFKTGDAVNNALRKLMEALPLQTRGKKKSA